MTDGRRDLQFQYNLLNLPAVTETLESIAHDEGRFVALSASPGTTTAQFIDTWHVRDYLGSVRTVLDITRDTAQVSDPALGYETQIFFYDPTDPRWLPDSPTYIGPKR